MYTFKGLRGEGGGRGYLQGAFDVRLRGASLKGGGRGGGGGGPLSSQSVHSHGKNIKNPYCEE